MKKITLTILKETLVQMVLSVILVAVAAFGVLKISPPQSAVLGIILAIYGIASFVGGMLLGKVMEKRKFLWGLAAGAIYISIILLVSLVVGGKVGAGTVDVTTGILVSLLAGMVGGMLG